MTKKTLSYLIQCTEIGGIATTVVGICVTMSADPLGGWVALVGVAFTCIGVFAQHKLTNNQKAEDDARIEDLENRLFESEEITKHPGVADAIADWEVEHQDDGR